MGVKEYIAAAAAAELQSGGQREALERAVAATGRSGAPQDRAQVGQMALAVIELLRSATTTSAQETPPDGTISTENETEAGRSVLELTLRLIRNATVEAAAVEELEAHGLLAELAASLRMLASAGPCPETTVGSQLLANLTVGAAATGRLERIQSSFFPGVFLDLAAVEKQSTQGPLCLALYVLTKGSTDFCQALLRCFPDTPGGERSLLRLLLDASAVGEGGGEDLARLLGCVAYREGQLGALIGCCRELSTNIPAHTPSNPSLTTWSYELELLQLLSESSWSCFSEASSPKCQEAMHSLVAYLRETAKRLTSEPGNEQDIARLQMGLQLLQSLTSSEENADPTASKSFSAVIRMLCDAEALGLLLAMIKALPPIEPRGAAAERQETQGAETSEPMKTVDPSSSLSDEAADLPGSSVFHGYRSYLVAVIGNMAFRQPHVQDIVTSLGGVELLLSQCQVDDQSPMVREWALWAVRNLTEGNAEAQQRIRDLEVCKAVDSPELQAMGKELEYDPALGKMRLADRKDGKGQRPPHQR